MFHEFLRESLTDNVAGMVRWRVFTSVMRQRASHDGAERPLMAVSTEARQMAAPTRVIGQALSAGAPGEAITAILAKPHPL